MNLLEINNLSVSYYDVHNPIVHGINLKLDKGKVLSIIGESGSGKTTIVRAILNILPSVGKILNGSIIFEGKNLSELDQKEWQQLRGKDISMIFQDSGNMLNPIQTIGKQFIEYIQIHGSFSKREAHDLAMEKLTLMNLPEPQKILGSYAFELSGGMRQRIGIAMAITFNPKILLADEPTSALDVTTQAQIIGELMFVTHGLGTAMIIITHNIGIAACISDELMVMFQGELIEYDKTEKVINHPKCEYTKHLLSSIPELGKQRYV